MESRMPSAALSTTTIHTDWLGNARVASKIGLVEGTVRKTSSAAPVRPKRIGVRDRMSAERRDRIQLAARKLLSANGYEATTLRQVAKAAGVGLGTLFSYIRDKRDLIYVIFNGEVDRVADLALAAPRHLQTFDQRILGITEPHFRMFAEDPVLSRILLSEVLMLTPGSHLNYHLSIRNRLIRGIADVVVEAQERGEIRSLANADVIAKNIFFAFSGTVRWWIAASAHPDWRAGQAEFEDLLTLQLNGLRALPSDESVTSPVRTEQQSSTKTRRKLLELRTPVRGGRMPATTSSGNVD